MAAKCGTLGTFKPNDNICIARLEGNRVCGDHRSAHQKNRRHGDDQRFANLPRWWHRYVDPMPTHDRNQLYSRYFDRDDVA